MRIALFSDLHLEFNAGLSINATGADVIVLAGDIGPLEQALSLGEHLVAQYRVPVIFVPGNHEYYGQDLPALNQYLRDWREPTGLLHVLIDRALVLNGVRFLGTTLWTDFRLHGALVGAAATLAAKRFIPDFKMIRYANGTFTPTLAKGLHQAARQFLERELYSSEEPCVVVSHFAPHGDCCAPRYARSPLTPYFINDCSDLIERHQPLCWLFGHTHHSVDFKVGETRVVANQHGYPHELERVSGFAMDKRIQLTL